MSLSEVHGRLGTTALYFMILMALWGLFRYFRKEGVNSNYWGALVIGEILILVQGLLGAYLWIIGARPERSLHVLYGIAAALVIPGVYAYTKGNEERRAMLVYGVALVVAVLLTLRAITTAGA
jgi:CDP-diglyceride synthetase